MKSRAISERFTGRDRGVPPDQGSGLKMGDSWALSSRKLSSSWPNDGFRCFRYYLPSKFHALSSLCLAGLSTYVAGCHRNTVRERYQCFLPFVDRRFKMEYIKPSAGQLALPKQFQQTWPIDYVSSRSIDQVGPPSHHRQPFAVEKMVSLRSVWNVDRDNLGLLQKLFDRFSELITESRHPPRLDDVIAENFCLETHRENP